MYAFGRKKRKNPTKKKWVVSRLNERVQVLKPVQVNESDGSLSQKYLRLTTIWGAFNPISHTAYQRWSSIENFESISHEFIFRYSAVNTLHTEYGQAFSGAFDNIADLNPLKGDIYLMVEKSTSGVTKGRLFRIRRILNDEENDEYLSVLSEEIEELGTGAVIGPDYIS